MTGDINSDAVRTSAVRDVVVFHHISVRPEVLASWVISKQNSDPAAVGDSVVAHDVVGVIVTDRHAVTAIAIQVVVFRQSELDAPAPEESLVVAIHSVGPYQRALRSGPGMNAQIRVVMAVAVLHHNVVTDLKTDAVTVVIPSRHAVHGVSIAVLQEDTATVVAIEICAIGLVAVQDKILDNNVGRVFTGQKRKQR